MKFGEQISAHLTPEWRKQYIAYEQIKIKLYELQAKAPPAEGTENRMDYFARQDELFSLLESELRKVNLFFSMKIAEAQTKYHELQHDLDAIKATSQKRFDESSGKRKLLVLNNEKQQTTKNINRLKSAFSEFYLALVLVQNYQQMNKTGFRKILKKLDKLLQTDKGLQFYENEVSKSAFVLNNDVDVLLAKTERIVINELEAGNRHAAMKFLRVQPLNERESAWTTFRLGLYMGCFLVLCCIIASELLIEDNGVTALLNTTLTATLTEELTEEYQTWVGLRLFRGFLLLFINCMLIGLNVYGWQRAGVNHVLIFEIDPRDHLTYQQMMEFASFFCVLWTLCVTGCRYLFAPLLRLPQLVFPIVMVLTLLVWFIYPFHAEWSHKSSRYWLLSKIRICFSAPFAHVAFADFWLADQMNSLVTSFIDLGYFVCFYATQVDYFAADRPFIDFKVFERSGNTTELFQEQGQDYCSGTAIWRPLISVIPALIRLLQCFRRYRDSRQAHPHLTNAAKYATSFLVIFFGYARAVFEKDHPTASLFSNPYAYFWVGAYIISFFYTYSWDLFMDWSLLDPNHGWLREELVYSKYWYYCAILADCVLRLSWTLNVTLAASGLSAHSTGILLLQPDILLCITGLLECFRRFVWNFFRLENEHVNNVGKFRAVRDISLKPMKKGELERLLARMDNDDGVTHRGMELTHKSLEHIKMKKYRHGMFKRHDKVAP